MKFSEPVGIVFAIVLGLFGFTQTSVAAQHAGPMGSQKCGPDAQRMSGMMRDMGGMMREMSGSMERGGNMDMGQQKHMAERA